MLERERDLALGAADEPRLREPLVDLVGDGGGRADGVQLAGLLDRALGLDEPAAGDELDAVGQRLAQARVLAHADVMVLEAQAQVACGPAVAQRTRRSPATRARGRSPLTSACARST